MNLPTHNSFAVKAYFAGLQCSGPPNQSLAASVRLVKGQSSGCTQEQGEVSGQYRTWYGGVPCG